MKRIICVMAMAVGMQIATAQSNTVTGDLTVTGKLAVGTTSMPRSFNVFKTFGGLPSLPAPIESYTTGLRISHNWSGVPGTNPYVEYKWDLGADHQKFYFSFLNTNTQLMVFKATGEVGIGTTSPATAYKLHIKNSSAMGGTALRVDAINGQIRLFETDDPTDLDDYTQIERNGGAFHIYHNDASTGLFTPVLTSTMDGKISMGVPLDKLNTPGNYRLYVAGGIITEQVKVALLSSAQWADYVFDDDYKLMRLEEVESFINQNHHLPNIPSADSVAANGINVATMDAKLLEKIEELTLYIIEQQKQIEAMQVQLEKLKETNKN